MKVSGGGSTVGDTLKQLLVFNQNLLKIKKLLAVS